MDEVTLILTGLTILFYFVQLARDSGRVFSMGGSIVGVCAIASLITEPWTNYTLFILLPLVYLVMMLIVGVIYEKPERT